MWKTSVVLFFFTVVTGACNTPIKLVGRVIKEFYWTIPNSPKGMTQTEAAEFCASHGMTLASIKNAEEQSISYSIGAGKTLNGNQGYNFWLSGTQVKEGTWLWNDGTPIQYNRWHQGWGPQPRNSPDINCLFISPTYWAGSGWFDNTCSDTLFPLCEKISVEYYGQGY